jgi:hypothetical protein
MKKMDGHASLGEWIACTRGEITAMPNGMAIGHHRYPSSVLEVVALEDLWI